MRLIVFILFCIIPAILSAGELYRRNDKADTGGTYLVKDIEVIPLFLVSRFGEPSDGDGLRVSGELIFTSASGQVFIIHDSKNTTVWSSDEGLPTAKEFWSSDKKQELSLNSKDEYDYKSFINWVFAEQKIWLSNFKHQKQKHEKAGVK